MVSFADDPSLNTEFDLSEKAQGGSAAEALHVIQGLETLQSVAALYGSSVAGIMRVNGLVTDQTPAPGTPVLVPLELPQAEPITKTEFYLQLGAFSSEPIARTAVAKFSDRFAAILTGNRFRVVPPEANARQVYRVTVGPYQSAQIADNKCTLLKLEGASCLIREEQRAPSEQKRGERKVLPTYVAVLGLRGQSDDIIVSEGDRLGNKGGVVVSIFQDRLIVQEGGTQAVLSMNRELKAPPAPPPPPPVVVDDGTANDEVTQ